MSFIVDDTLIFSISSVLCEYYVTIHHLLPAAFNKQSKLSFFFIQNNRNVVRSYFHSGSFEKMIPKVIKQT